MATDLPDPAPLSERLFVLLQHVLPHHLLSALMYQLTRSDWPPLRRWLIKTVVSQYRVDMREAAEPDPLAYPTFNAFFTRALRADARPLVEDPQILLCPADGQISQLGDIEGGLILQAKGHRFSVESLLGGNGGGNGPWATRFARGKFVTVYLSPRDYHRVHMPYAGTLRAMRHVPGRLYSVNPVTTRGVPGLFARNERVVCLFETAVGPMALVLVGAIFVASMDTVWGGTVTPASRRVSTWTYGEERPAEVRLAQGAEMGRFNMGSTVILLLGEGAADWSPELVAGQAVRMGDLIGRAYPAGGTGRA